MSASITDLARIMRNRRNVRVSEFGRAAGNVLDVMECRDPRSCELRSKQQDLSLRMIHSQLLQGYAHKFTDPVRSSLFESNDNRVTPLSSRD